MKKNIITIIFLLIATVSFGKEKSWSNWQESSVRGIDFRVAYDYFNKFSAQEGKPAHVWCVEIRNRFESNKGISWCIGDENVKSRDNIKDQRRNFCLKSGSTDTSCLHFTNTPEGGSVVVFIWDVKDSNISENERTKAKEQQDNEKIAQQKKEEDEKIRKQQDAQLEKDKAVQQKKDDADNLRKQQEAQSIQNNRNTQATNSSYNQQNKSSEAQQIARIQQAENQEKERKVAQEEDYQRRVDAEAERKRNFQAAQKAATNVYIQQTESKIANETKLVNDLGNIFQSALNQRAEYKAREAEKEERERIAKENRQIEYEKQREEEERVRRIEEARRAEERRIHNELVGNRRSLILKFPEGSTPLSLQNINDKEIYFFIYSFQESTLENANPEIFISNVFSVKKYSDDTWPFKKNLKEKISASIKNLDFKLSGFYVDKNESEQRQQFFVKNAKSYDFIVKNVFYENEKPSDNVNSNTDFWGNSTINKEKLPSSLPPTANSSEDSKAKVDFWGNTLKK